MDKSRTDIDRIFDRGISDVERMPRKTLSEAEIAAAAAVSKSGAGVFLLSHSKEILLCTLSFAAGCLVMIAVLHLSVPKPSEPQTDATIITKDTVALMKEPSVTVVETESTTSLHMDRTISQSDNPTSNVIRSTPHITRPKSKDPVVVRKTITKHDTVLQRENIVVKDTVYLFTN